MRGPVSGIRSGRGALKSAKAEGLGTMVLWLFWQREDSWEALASLRAERMMCVAPIVHSAPRSTGKSFRVVMSSPALSHRRQNAAGSFRIHTWAVGLGDL